MSNYSQAAEYWDWAPKEHEPTHASVRKQCHDRHNRERVSARD